MKTKLMRFLSASRYSTECTKCLQFRRYCSKSDDKTSKASEKYLKNPEDLIRFEAPEQKIHLQDYAKPVQHYFKEDMKNAFSFLKREKNVDMTDRQNFPYDVEFLILGAGPMGSAIAFWLKKTMSKTIPVLVIDKDLSIKEAHDTSEVSESTRMCALEIF